MVEFPIRIGRVLAQFHVTDFLDDLVLGFFNGVAEKWHGGEGAQEQVAEHGSTGSC
jgi:hypothetical protein